MPWLLDVQRHVASQCACVPRHPTGRIGVHDVFPARAPSSFSGAACRRINIALHNPGSVSARLDPLAYSIGLFLLLNISFSVVKKSI